MKLLIIAGLVILGCWAALISHLWVEWSINPQYGYGFAVPFLVLYLLWENVGGSRGRARLAERASVVRYSIAENVGGSERSAIRNRALPLLAVFVCAFLLLPTHVIGVSSPDWRLVSWLLSLEVIGITLALIALAGGRQFLARTWFPIVFFLVAVPWLGVIERPLIQWLTSENAAVTVHVLNLFGTPAIQRGNVIEIAAGVVGIDEACSGIRSFQATLMISLFLGELFRLTLFRRVICVFGGFALSFILNVCRTALLTYVASRNGISAIDRWHDPAGITILLGCFLGLAGLALALKKEGATSVNPQEAQQPSLAWGRISPAVPIGLGLWLMFTLVATELWYRSREVSVTTPEWSVQWPTNAAGFAESAWSEKETRLLRYTRAQKVKWADSEKAQWQGFFIEWEPGRAWVNMISVHNPSVCLPAAGWKQKSVRPLAPIHYSGVDLQFGGYEFEEDGVPIFVFHCLWEAGAGAQRLGPESATVKDRLRAVAEGRRNRGIKVLELALFGMANQEEAEAAFRAHLQDLIVVNKVPADK